MSANDAPPSYDKALSQQPADPARNAGNGGGGADLARTQSASSEGGDPFEGMSPDEQREMADEYRDLPDGWVKCWDPKNQHSYYVEEKTERAIWTHPYDDPEYLQSLPDTHPANPNSEAARERREQIRKASLQVPTRDGQGESDLSATDEDESGPGMSSRAAMRNDADAEDKGWFQRQKDKISDKRERRAQRKAEERKQRAEQERQIRAQVEEYRKKRAELLRGQIGAQGMGRQPMYAPPSMGYRSIGGLGPSYGYGMRPMGLGGMGMGGYGGYGGYGYGRRPMGMGMGMPLGMGMMGGLGTGMLLGGAMGGYGGGFGGDCGGGDGGGGDGGGGGE